MVGAAQTTPQTRPYTVDWENCKTRLGDVFNLYFGLGYAQLTIRSTIFSQGDLEYKIPQKNKEGTADMRPAKYWTEVIIICPHSPK